MTSTQPLLQVYWRPGCSYCTSMRVALNEGGVDAAWHNIREDVDAAAFVRSAADGNETVPTVRYDDRVLVAPRPAVLLEGLRRDHPELAIRPYRRWQPLRVVQWVGVVALLVLGQLLARAGDPLWAWGADATALAIYLTLRRIRSRPRVRPTAA